MSDDTVADSDREWLGPIAGPRRPRSLAPAPQGWTPEVLRALLARWEAEEAAGPHVVVAVGRVVRYFGPFPTQAAARAAAGAEEAAWRAEFPDSDVLFEVAPLVDGARLARP